MRPKHKAVATQCGRARRDDGLTSWWSLVTCEDCLRDRPLPVRQDHIWRCADVSCNAVLGAGDCRLCIRCRAHCLPSAPGDEAAHLAHAQSLPPMTTHRRRR